MAGNGVAGANAVEAWVAPRKAEVDRIRMSVHEIANSGLTLSKLSVAASLLGDLVNIERPAPASGKRMGKRSNTALMPEMPRAREHHGDAVVVGGLDHLVVAHGAAGLDHGGGAGFDRDQEAVGEGKERVGCDHGAQGQRFAEARRPSPRPRPCARRCGRN